MQYNASLEKHCLQAMNDSNVVLIIIVSITNGDADYDDEDDIAIITKAKYMNIKTN